MVFVKFHNMKQEKKNSNVAFKLKQLTNFHFTTSQNNIIITVHKCSVFFLFHLCTVCFFFLIFVLFFFFFLFVVFNSVQVSFLFLSVFFHWPVPFFSFFFIINCSFTILFFFFFFCTNLVSSTIPNPSLRISISSKTSKITSRLSWIGLPSTGTDQISIDKL